METAKVVLLVVMGLLMSVTLPMAVPNLWLKKKREGLLGILILALALTALVLILWF